MIFEFCAGYFSKSDSLLALDGGGVRFGQVGDRIARTMQDIGFAAILWEFFKALLHGVLDCFRKTIGTEAIESIVKAVDATVEEFLIRVFQAAPNQSFSSKKPK